MHSGRSLAFLALVVSFVSCLVAWTVWGGSVGVQRLLATVMVGSVTVMWLLFVVVRRDLRGALERQAALERFRQELVAQEQLLRGVVDSAPMAIVLVNDPGRVVYSNHTARQLFFEGAPLEGEDLFALLERAPAPLQEAVAADEDALFSVSGTGEPETYHLSKRHFDLSGARHVVLSVRRLTREVHRQEVEIWKKLIRTVSHELNNSLAPIGSLARSARAMVLGGAPGSPGDLELVFDTIDERAQHLAQFVSEYAALARLPKPRPAPCVLSDLAERITQLSPQIQVCAAPGASGCFDRIQVEQVLLNLLRNAEEAGSVRTAIELEMSRVDSSTLLRVLDRGAGMTKKVLENALLPFYSTKEKGMGLGLALCREIVEAHGGRIRLENRHGGGLVVSVWLPDPDTPEMQSDAKLTLSRA